MPSPNEFLLAHVPTVRQLKASLRPLIGPRGEPKAEVYHNFANLFGPMLYPEEGPDLRQNDAQAMRSLRQFVASAESCLTRMRAWERQIDFAPLGLSEKPSEATERFLNDVTDYLASIPRLPRIRTRSEIGRS